MTTPRRAYEQLRRIPALHTTALVYDTLLREAYQGPEGHSNGEIATLLGLSHTVMLRHLRVLKRLGLIAPVQVHKTKGYDVIFVLAEVADDTMQVLDDLQAGRAAANLRNGSLGTGDAPFVDLSVRNEQLLARTRVCLSSPDGRETGVLAADTTTTGGYTPGVCEDTSVLAKGVYFASQACDCKDTGVLATGETRSRKDTGVLASGPCQDTGVLAEPARQDTGVLATADDNARARCNNSLNTCDHSLNCEHTDTSSDNKNKHTHKNKNMQQSAGARDSQSDDSRPVVRKPKKTPSGRRREMQDPAVEAQIDQVLEAWRAAMDYPDARLTPKRRGYVRGRLAEGFTVEELLRIIAWAKDDEFLRGKNDRNRAYDDVDTLFRSRDRVEKYLANAARDQKRKTKDRSLLPAREGEDRKGWVF